MDIFLEFFFCGVTCDCFGVKFLAFDFGCQKRNVVSEELEEICCWVVLRGGVSSESIGW